MNIETPRQVSIMTLGGARQPSDFQNYEIILSHEHLIQNLTRYFLGDKNSIAQIELKNYSHVKENPYQNLSNLALNDIEEICTELKLSFGDSKILIVESTNLQNGQEIDLLNKISLRMKVDLIAGYKPIIKGVLYSDDEKNKVFINVEKFEREIQEALFEEKKSLHSGFLGELFLEEELFDKHQIVIFESCVKQAVQYGSPLYVEVQRTKDFDLLNRFIETLTKFSGGSQIQLVLWNLDLTSSKQLMFDQGQNQPYIKTDLKNVDVILEVIKKGFRVGFDVYSYIDELFELATLVKILVDRNLHNYLLISSGVKFKTHLKKYGGAGYDIVLKFIEILKSLNITTEQIEVIFKTNVLELMNWWKPLKVKEVYVKMWSCDTCHKEFPDTVQRFAKLGKEFCTAKCMREFKYE